MNAIEAINLATPNYIDPGHPFGNASRANQVLATFDNQYAATLGRPAHSTEHSLRSQWGHDKKKMQDLIDRHSAQGGPALPLAAPGAVVVGQQQHLAGAQPLAVSYFSSASSYQGLGQST